MEQVNSSSSTPCASSCSVGMISTKCPENVSKSADIDCIIVPQEDDLATKSTQEKEQPAKRKKPLKSEVWKDFDRIESEVKGIKKVDARYKMAIVTYAYEGMYDHRADIYIDDIREFLVQIFNEYSEKFGSKRGFVENSGSASFGTASSVGGEWLGGFQDFVATSNLRKNTRKSELEEYLNEGLFPTDSEVEFDILHWWKLNGPKFPILARMAQDILAIPTSSVASESSFSKCRRIITDTRSSLNDDSVETLMCVKDWLPDVKDGQFGKASEDDASKACDFSSNDWDLDF